MVKKGTIDAVGQLSKGNRQTRGGNDSNKSSTKDKENTKPSLQQPTRHVVQSSSCSTMEKLNMGSANIDKIIQFIEGGPQYESAKKKADKKARQKQKKEEEKRRREEEDEALRKAEEERIRREKALAEQQRVQEELALQKTLKKKKKQQQQTEESKAGSKKKGKEPEHFEQTIPAMVTIKRIVENNNSPPTVTITLKGSTPDQDKLLYTLVNGHDAPIITSPPPPPKEVKEKDKSRQESSKTSEKHKKKVKNQQNGSKKGMETVQTSEIKVQLTIDKSFRSKLKQDSSKTTQQAKKDAQGLTKDRKQAQKVPATGHTQDKEIIDIPSLKLPPGITITKVNGPLASRKSNVQSSQGQEYQDVPVSKSGVIVVDTEKLIQQQTGRKKKKKGKKAAAQAAATANGSKRERVQVKASNNSSASASATSITSNNNSGMVKLTNPIFHHTLNKSADVVMNMNEQATISRGENGMVTIRRPRPVGFYPPPATATNESPINEFLSSSSSSSATSTEAPSKREPILTPWQMPDNTSMSALSDERKIIRPPSPRTVQWPRATKLNTPSVLQGLPGIEITRVRSGSPAVESGEYVEPPADVSIIRTSAYKLEKQNWTAFTGSKP